MQRKDEIVEAHGWASPDSCILYKGEVDSYGYGRVWTGEAKMQAHRYSLMQWQELDEANRRIEKLLDEAEILDAVEQMQPHFKLMSLYGNSVEYHETGRSVSRLVNRVVDAGIPPSVPSSPNGG